MLSESCKPPLSRVRCESLHFSSVTPWEPICGLQMQPPTCLQASLPPELLGLWWSWPHHFGSMLRSPGFLAGARSPGQVGPLAWSLPLSNPPSYCSLFDMMSKHTFWFSPSQWKQKNDARLEKWIFKGIDSSQVARLTRNHYQSHLGVGVGKQLYGELYKRGGKEMKWENHRIAPSKFLNSAVALEMCSLNYVKITSLSHPHSSLLQRHWQLPDPSACDPQGPVLVWTLLSLHRHTFRASFKVSLQRKLILSFVLMEIQCAKSIWEAAWCILHDYHYMFLIIKVICAHHQKFSKIKKKYKDKNLPSKENFSLSHFVIFFSIFSAWISI